MILNSRCLKSFAYALIFSTINLSLNAQTFSEVSSDAGINTNYEATNLLGGGLAWFDYNLDGFEDVYITGGHNHDKLYRNNGDGTFTDVTAIAGFSETDLKNTTAVVTGDIDNDGYREVFVSTWNSGMGLLFQKNLLYYNNGDGTFTEIGESAGLSEQKLSMSASFIDVNLDGYLDIFVGNYIEEAVVLLDNQCQPIGFDHTCFMDDLYINNGDLTFTLGTEEYEAFNDGCTLALVATDYDRDNDPDLMLVNDFGEWVLPDRLLENNYPDTGFSDVSDASMANIQIYGMGVAVGDYDEDQDFDYYFTNIGRNVLLQNNGDGTFEDQTLEADVENIYYGNSYAAGWGTFFFDYDNDTYLDLFLSNGHINALCFIENDTQQNNTLYRNNQDGTFSDITTTELPQNQFYSRGCAWADFDNDGALDFGVLDIHNQFEVSNDKFNLYSNIGNESNYTQVKLEGSICNRDAFGSVVECHANERTFIRELNGGSSYCSQNSSVLHFGLGDIEEIDSLVVYWPAGDTQVVESPAINSLNYILQDSLFTTPVDTLVVDTTFVDTTVVDTSGTYIQDILRKYNLRYYPNPINNFFNLEYYMPNSQSVSMVLFDITGRKVWEMYEGALGRGSHKTVIEIPSSLLDGVYIFEFQIGETRMTNKLQILRK